jgi:hypothetical protein
MVTYRQIWKKIAKNNHSLWHMIGRLILIFDVMIMIMSSRLMVSSGLIWVRPGCVIPVQGWETPFLEIGSRKQTERSQHRSILLDQTSAETRNAGSRKISDPLSGFISFFFKNNFREWVYLILPKSRFLLMVKFRASTFWLWNTGSRCRNC